VLLKVLRVPSTSSLVYQSALLSNELKTIFANAPNPAAMANATVVQHYQAVKTGQDPNKAGAGNSDGEKVARRPIEGDCPICFDSLREADRVKIDYCRSCGNNVHLECFNNWKTSKKHGKITCVYCRAVWYTEAKGDDNSPVKKIEGYLNMGTLAALPSTRDESTYSS
jgi:hypothetical protein